jgi:hypothetical protein
VASSGHSLSTTARISSEHVLAQPFQVCGHHDLAADNAGLIGALFGHSRRQLLANAVMAASRVAA